MSSITESLAESNRPVVNVRIRSSPNDSSPADGVALIDTGSTMSFVDRETALRKKCPYRYLPNLSILSRGSTEDGVGFYLCHLEIVGLAAWGNVPMASIDERSAKIPFVAERLHFISTLRRHGYGRQRRQRRYV